MKPVRNPDHLRWIRSLPCLACAYSGKLNQRNIEAAHTSGSRGMGQKRSDLETVPLCRTHHDAQHAMGWPKFIAKYGLDIRELLKVVGDKPALLPYGSHGNPEFTEGSSCYGAFFSFSDTLILCETLEESLRILPQRRAEQLTATYFTQLSEQARARIARSANAGKLQIVSDSPEERQQQNTIL